MDLQTKWDTIYRVAGMEAEAAEVLREYQCLLPETGRALDLACGLGENALLLARHGLTTEAWDISGVAIEVLAKKSRAANLHVQARQVKITPTEFSNKKFDVIVVSRFLDRSLCPVMMDALKPDGLLFYQTFTQDKITASGPSNPDYLLQRNELLTLFRPLAVVLYQELSRLGDIAHGNRNEALLIAQKRVKP